MKRTSILICLSTLAVATATAIGFSGAAVNTASAQQAQAVADAPAAAEPDERAVQRARETVKILDNIFKQTIVLITDKYVHDESDFAAGSAAVLLFENISGSSDNKVRLIDATGDPYDSENVAKDAFEKAGIKKLKAGAKTHEEVVTKEGESYLRALTPVPVVMQKCVMCHPHYEDVAEGEPIGAISYTIPIN